MPRVRYTSDGGRYRTGGVTFEPGDEHDLPQGLAEHLVTSVDDFEYADELGSATVDENSVVDTLDAATTGGDEPAAGGVHEEDGPPDDASADDDADADAAAGGFDIDEWLDHDYQDRADRVEAGEVDAHLDTIAEAETSDTVLDAVGVRRAELEEE